MRWLSISVVCIGWAGCSFTPGGAAQVGGDSGDARQPPPDGLVQRDAAGDAAPIDAPSNLGCPVGWTMVAGSGTSYLIDVTGQTWWDAEAGCVGRGQGGLATHLAVIDSDGEANGVAALFPKGATYWIGQVQKPGQTFKWQGWQKLTGGDAHTRWQNFQPDDNGIGERDREDFAELDDGGQMNDLDGAQQRGALCECDGKPQDPAVQVQAPHPP